MCVYIDGHVYMISPFSDSPEERKAVETACSYLNSSGLGICTETPTPEPLKAVLQLDMEGEKALWPGNPIDQNIVVKNETVKAWTVDLAASCQLESYTGKVEASLATIKKTVQTEGKTGEQTKKPVVRYCDACSLL